MAYNNNCPQPPDLLPQSQGEFRDNFEQLDTAINVNHVGFNNGADSGKHNMCTFYTIAPNLVPNALANEAILTGFLSTFTQAPEMAYRSPATGNFFGGLTGRRTPLPQVGASWAYLGGDGLLMKWGYAALTGSGAVLFPDDNSQSIPRFGGAPYSIQISPISIAVGDEDVAVRMIAKTTRQFTVFCSPRTLVGATEVAFFYLAIGR